MLWITIVCSNFAPKKGMENRNEILIHFGKTIQSMRKDRNLSQEMLAEKAGLHRTYIGMIERAEKNVTLINIQRIANALGVTIKDLFEK